MALTDVGWIMYPSTYTQGTAGAFALDAAEELIAYVIKVPKTGTLKKIGWRIYSVSSPSLTCRVSIETVAETVGQPVATTDAGKTLYATGAVSADITDPAAGSRYDAINGSSGISVTKGDNIAIVIRIISRTSGSISPNYAQYAATLPMGGLSGGRDHSYTATYANSAWGAYNTPMIGLEYDGEFVPCPFTNPPFDTGGAVSFSSSSTPDRRGLKFRFPYKCTAKGIVMSVDLDSETDLILYDSDEYTVMSGFPITLNANKRAAANNGFHYVEFPTEPTFEANTDYRIVLLPKSTTAISITYSVPVTDGSLLALDMYPEGTNVINTVRTGAPSSGDHSWTDYNTQRYSWAFVVNKIDFSSGSSGGGCPVMGGMIMR